MKDTNSRIALYKEAISLEEKRAALRSQLNDLESRIATVQGQLFDSGGSAVSSPTPVAKSAGAKPAAPRASLSGKRAGRGELKNQLLSILSAAGSGGISVKEITAATGAKPTSVHSWLQAARKQYPIKRISQGRYRLEGKAPVVGAAKAKPGRPPGKPGRPSGRPAGKPSKRSTRPLSRRGELMTKIMSELKAAGSAGVKIPELSDKFGVKRKNLFIWFATTGRRNPAIKKVGESHYRLEDSGQ
jgi:hypothetical protein